MAKIADGTTVVFNYVGKLADGTIFDSTLEGGCSDEDCSTGDCSTDDCGCDHETGPMHLVLGSEGFFPAVEAALAEMSKGEKRSVVVPADDAFGAYDDDKVFTVPRSDLPADFAAEEGDELILSGEDDEEFGVTVAEITADEITFDANHPLAGEDLTFEVELLDIL